VVEVGGKQGAPWCEILAVLWRCFFLGRAHSKWCSSLQSQAGRTGLVPWRVSRGENSLQIHLLPDMSTEHRQITPPLSNTSPPTPPSHTLPSWICKSLSFLAWLHSYSLALNGLGAIKVCTGCPGVAGQIVQAVTESKCRWFVLVLFQLVH
jgi:hypothetical protein